MIEVVRNVSFLYHAPTSVQQERADFAQHCPLLGILYILKSL